MPNVRKYSRFPMSGLVVVKVPSLNLQFSGMIELIAFGGIGIYTREKVNQGSPVLLQIIGFAGSNTSNYNLTGVVRNTDRQKEFGVLGIQFDQPISSNEQPILYDFLTREEKKLTSWVKSG
ncbi:MAG: PilZ domain-containing protein [Nitrospirae bacterium]|nr:PilZ domain-containing protein [Nitrospirota bacterium]